MLIILKRFQELKYLTIVLKCGFSVKKCYLRISKLKVKAVCGSYSTAALRHIVLLPE